MVNLALARCSQLSAARRVRYPHSSSSLAARRQPIATVTTTSWTTNSTRSPAASAGARASFPPSTSSSLSFKRRDRRFVAAAAAAGAAGADVEGGGGSSDDPWNKGPLDMDNRLYAYLLANTREPDVLRRLRVETSTMRGSQMQVPPEQGAFLALIVELMGAKNIIEVCCSLSQCCALFPFPTRTAQLPCLAITTQIPRFLHGSFAREREGE